MEGISNSRSSRLNFIILFYYFSSVYPTRLYSLSKIWNKERCHILSSLSLERIFKVRVCLIYKGLSFTSLHLYKKYFLTINFKNFSFLNSLNCINQVLISRILFIHDFLILSKIYISIIIYDNFKSISIARIESLSLINWSINIIICYKEISSNFSTIFYFSISSKRTWNIGPLSF